jgi:hypothetical protein
MKEMENIKNRYGIPKYIKTRVIDYSRLSDRKIIQRLKKIESSLKGKDETFEDASMNNELRILRQEVRRRNLQITV